MEDISLRKARAGTYAYMSPESLMGNIQDQKTDLWSLGILLYELHMGREPFPGKSSSDMLHLISNQPIKFSSKFFTRESMNLVKALLKFKPFKRICINDLLNSNFLRRHSQIDFRYSSVREAAGGRNAPEKVVLKRGQKQETLQRKDYRSGDLSRSLNKDLGFDPPEKIFTSRFKNVVKAGRKEGGKEKVWLSDYCEETLHKTLDKSGVKPVEQGMSLYKISDNSRRLRGANRMTSRGRRTPKRAKPPKVQLTRSKSKRHKRRRALADVKKLPLNLNLEQAQDKNSFTIETPRTVRKNQTFKMMQTSDQSLGFLSKEEAINNDVTLGSNSRTPVYKSKKDSTARKMFKKENATTKMAATNSVSLNRVEPSSFKTVPCEEVKHMMSTSMGQANSIEVERLGPTSLRNAPKLDNREFSENKEFKSEENHFVKSQMSIKMRNQIKAKKAFEKDKRSEEFMNEVLSLNSI